MCATTFKCKACKKEKQRNPRLKPGEQEYCSDAPCQREANRVRQQRRMTNNEKYRQDQLDAKKAWWKENPDYLKEYRRTHTDVVDRNRVLQRVRDAKRRGRVLPSSPTFVSGPVHSLSPVTPENNEMSIPAGAYVMKRIDKPSPPVLFVRIDVAAVVTSKHSVKESLAGVACKDDVVPGRSDRS